MVGIKNTDNECVCRKISEKAVNLGLPAEWYYCKKCFKSFLKKREKFIKDFIDSDIGSTVNFKLVEINNG